MKAWFLKGDTIVQKMIQAWTGPHSHMEIQFSNGTFVSSTTHDGPRFATFEQLASQDLNDWDVIDIPCTPEDEAIVRNLAHMIVAGLSGEKQSYDFADILLGFLKPLPVTVVSPDKWICSEVSTYICQSIGLFLGFVPQQLSPHAAYLILQAELPVWQAKRWHATESA